jgi:hypothetical protein
MALHFCSAEAIAALWVSAVPVPHQPSVAHPRSHLAPEPGDRAVGAQQVVVGSGTVARRLSQNGSAAPVSILMETGPPCG